MRDKSLPSVRRLGKVEITGQGTKIRVLRDGASFQKSKISGATVKGSNRPAGKAQIALRGKGGQPGGTYAYKDNTGTAQGRLGLLVRKLHSQKSRFAQDRPVY